MAVNVKKDLYKLGQSEKKSIIELAQEIRIDLSLSPNPNLHAGTIYGRVTDSQGNPIQGAVVKIMDAAHNPIGHGITGADGSYILSPFPPGPLYHAYCIAPGYLLAENLPFPLLPDQQVEENFTLAPDPNSSLAIIAGEVRNQTTDQPVYGGVVNLYLVDQSGQETLTAITFTNQYGQFIFNELSQGKYVVRIYALGYLPAASSVNITGPGQIVHIHIDMIVDPLSSRGTISGVITDEENNPIPGADVTLFSVDASGGLTPLAFTQTNSEGVYLFINVPKGDYKIKSNKGVAQQ